MRAGTLSAPARAAVRRLGALTLCVLWFGAGADALAAAGIQHVRATAAMFCWIDLREGLLRPGWEGERELWQALCDVGVLLTPGEPAAGLLLLLLLLLRLTRLGLAAWDSPLAHLRCPHLSRIASPGEACKAEEPGFFRVCWAWVPAAALPIMVERVAKLLAQRKASASS